MSVFPDINECDEDGTCDQKCTNREKSFECSCVPGYKKDGNKCIALNGKLSGTVESQLYVSQL